MVELKEIDQRYLIIYFSNSMTVWNINSLKLWKLESIIFKIILIICP